MLWNKEKKAIRNPTDCITCRMFDKHEKRCKGLGAICFEYDPNTKMCIDPVTKLRIKI